MVETASSSGFSSLRRLSGCFKPYWKIVSVALICLILGNILGLWMVWLVRPIVGAIAPATVSIQEPSGNIFQRFFGGEGRPAEPTAPASEKARAQMLLVACSKVLGIGIVKGIITFLGLFGVSYVGLQIIRLLRDRMYSHLQSLSASFFDREKTGHLMSRIISDTSLIERSVTEEFFNVVAAPVTIIGGLALMFILNWQLTLVSIVVFPLAALAIAKAGRRIRLLTGQMQSKLANLSVALQEALVGIRVIKASGTEEFEVEKFAGRNLDTARAAIKSARVISMLRPTIEIIAVVGFVAAFWFGGRQVISGIITPADLIAFVLLVQRIGTDANKLTKVHIVFQQTAAAADRVFGFLGQKPEIVEKEEALPLKVEEGRITFDHVSFSYDGTEPVLDDISFEIKPGEKLALVGPSGVGKTTIANLLLRLYECQSGSVCIEGHDVRDLTLKSLRENIAIVPQDPVLFTGTVAENISYGYFDATMEEIVSAAKAAHAHSFISALPEGYVTIVGERGVTLSGGQKQRIAIARALLRDPRILILDEATSSLDSESEAAVHAALENLMRGRTTLIIAHRLATVRDADRILVLKDGKIVESGTHASLISFDGLYRRLYIMQEGDKEA